MLPCSTVLTILTHQSLCCSRKTQNKYLIEQPLWKLLKTLGAHEALLMVEFTVTVDDLLCGCKAALTALTHGIGQRIGHIAKKKRKKNIIRTEVV